MAHSRSSNRLLPKHWWFWCSLLLVFSAIVYTAWWWSGLVGETDLFAAETISVRIGKPFLWSGEDWSREEDELLMERGGAELKRRIESQLLQIGFEKRNSIESGSDAQFVGSYRGSPQIQLKLTDGTGSSEAGVHYEISVDYSRELPNGSLRDRIRVAKTYKRFDEHLQKAFNNCRDRLLEDFPVYRYAKQIHE